MAKRNAELELLAQVDLFEGFAASELKKVLAVAKSVEYSEGATVTEQGAPGGRFYLIVDGSARVVVNGRTRQHLVRGDYFGEISLIDGEPRSATVVASTPLSTLSIVEWNFRPLLKSHPTMAYKLLVTLCRRLRSVEKAITP